MTTQGCIEAHQQTLVLKGFCWEQAKARQRPSPERRPRITRELFFLPRILAKQRNSIRIRAVRIGYCSNINLGTGSFFLADRKIRLA